ncbi:hypothetical protein C8Q77DRAFT_817283 [Trametes polyzona]|nr:hypothetical protein C8Q77DRAFT_817283 [Trametes polyzona]
MPVPTLTFNMAVPYPILRDVPRRFQARSWAEGVTKVSIRLSGPPMWRARTPPREQICQFPASCARVPWAPFHACLRPVPLCTARPLLPNTQPVKTVQQMLQSVYRHWAVPYRRVGGQQRVSSVACSHRRRPCRPAARRGSALGRAVRPAVRYAAHAL